MVAWRRICSAPRRATERSSPPRDDDVRLRLEAGSPGGRMGLPRKERLLTRRSGSCFRRRIRLLLSCGGRCLDCRKTLAETGLDEVRVDGGQRGLKRQVPMDPIGGIVRRLELAHVGEQLLSHRCRPLWPSMVRTERRLSPRGRKLLSPTLAMLPVSPTPRKLRAAFPPAPLLGFSRRHRPRR
jgi:hypothetical protein